MLTVHQRELWEAYEAVESRGHRADKMRALRVFLDSLESSATAAWFPWARSVAEQVVDQRRDFVIRQPLFDRAIFPALLAGYQNQLPGSARWLAGLANHWLRNPQFSQQLATADATEAGMLQAAIRHDPADRRSRLKLIDVIAGWMHYSLHELPAGVLYGIDGATLEQCQELEADLDMFCQLVAQEALQERYAQLIGACRHHFPAYRDYLLHRERYDDYAAYLSRNPAPLED
jgi:hypothetical protein